MLWGSFGTGDILDKDLFHTCEVQGGPEAVNLKAPFLSENNARQWLTQGYYFWIEDDNLAHDWGKHSIGGDYAILRVRVDLEPKENLDLIGSPKHINHFKKLISRYLEKMRNATGGQYNPTVHEVIAHYRLMARDNNTVFPFKAISCSDDSKNMKRNFIKSGKGEALPLNNRQQICIFEGNEDVIVFKEIIHPKSWCA